MATRIDYKKVPLHVIDRTTNIRKLNPDLFISLDDIKAHQSKQMQAGIPKEISSIRFDSIQSFVEYMKRNRHHSEVQPFLQSLIDDTGKIWREPTQFSGDSKFVADYRIMTMNEITVLDTIKEQYTRFKQDISNQNEFLTEFKRNLTPGMERRYAMHAKSEKIAKLDELLQKDKVFRSEFKEHMIDIAEGNNPMAKLAVGKTLFDLTIYKEFLVNINEIAEMVNRTNMKHVDINKTNVASFVFDSLKDYKDTKDPSYHIQLAEDGLVMRDIYSSLSTDHGTVNSLIQDGIYPRLHREKLPEIFDANKNGIVKEILDNIIPTDKQFMKDFRKNARRAADSSYKVNENRGYTTVNNPDDYPIEQFQLSRFFDKIITELKSHFENIGGAKYSYKVEINGAVEEGITSFHTKDTDVGQGALDFSDIQRKISMQIRFGKYLSDLHRTTFDHDALIDHIFDGLR